MLETPELTWKTVFVGGVWWYLVLLVVVVWCCLMLPSVVSWSAGMLPVLEVLGSIPETKSSFLKELAILILLVISERIYQAQVIFMVRPTY